MNPFKYGCTVQGEYFCPRPELTRQLSRYIESGQNVVIQGERRMGKTSLVLETTRSLKKITTIHVDLLLVRDVADLCQRLAAALARAETKSGLLEKLTASLARLRPTLTIDPNSGSSTVSLDAAAARSPESIDAVMDALMARTAHRRSCVVLDEFQDILDMEDGPRVLALLRSRIQLDSRTAYIFLGSVRNRMTDIFWDPQSPFYHSAAALPVGEIEDAAFLAFLRARFSTGRRELPEEAFGRIVSIARRTPGYVQELCDTLWNVTERGQTITDRDISTALETVFAREQDHYEIFIRRLTAIQTRVLKAIASRGGREVFSGGFLSAASVISTATVKRALEKLRNSGLVYPFNDEWRFVNPFFGEWAKRLP